MQSRTIFAHAALTVAAGLFAGSVFGQGFPGNPNPPGFPPGDQPPPGWALEGDPPEWAGDAPPPWVESDPANAPAPGDETDDGE
jgi:hypothetical protein